jgi:hypothetical protein
LAVLTELKTRGVADVCIVVYDGLKGLPDDGVSGGQGRCASGFVPGPRWILALNRWTDSGPMTSFSLRLW